MYYIDLIREFFIAHGVAMIISASASATIVLTWTHRYEILEKRMVAFLASTSVDGLEVRFRGLRITSITRKYVQQPPVVVPRASIGPPALQTQTHQNTPNLQTSTEAILYHYPESLPDAPLGIQMPRFINILSGTPPTETRVQAELVPVQVSESGIWRPALIDPVTNLPQHPIRQSRKKTKLRRAYSGEFVVKGDILGVVLPEGNPKQAVDVAAPANGMIISFSANPDVPVAKNAMVLIIASFGSVCPIDSPTVGTFHFQQPAEAPPAQLGSRVVTGRVVGYVKTLNHYTEVCSPGNGKLVRVCVRSGELVQYGTTLFQYLAD